MKRVGVLALQGDFAAHGAALARAGAEPVYVREREQFHGIDGLVIPGGESTTMLKLLRFEGEKKRFGGGPLFCALLLLGAAVFAPA